MDIFSEKILPRKWLVAPVENFLTLRLLLFYRTVYDILEVAVCPWTLLLLSSQVWLCGEIYNILVS